MNLKKLTLAGLFASLGIATLVGCDDNKKTENKSLASEVLSRVILTQEGSEVKADFTVPRAVIYGQHTYEISWTSTDPSVLAIVDNEQDKNNMTYKADVKRPFGNDGEAVDVVLTAAVTADGIRETVDFKTQVSNITVENAMTDAIKALGIKGTYAEDAELTLPSVTNEYKDPINFTYALQGTYEKATFADNKLKLVAGSGVENIKFDVTASHGSDTKTQTFEIAVGALSLTYADSRFKTPKEIKDLADNTNTWFYGYVKKIVDDKYGNFYIEDKDGNEIYIYGIYQSNVAFDKYDGSKTPEDGIKYEAWAESTKLKVGDFVSGFGLVTTYKQEKQIKNAVLYKPLSVKEALDVDPTNKPFVLVEGTFKNYDSNGPKYGNIWIEDKDGNEILVYGLSKGDIASCYDENNNWIKENPSKGYSSWGYELQAGDRVVVYGKRTKYGTKQEIENCLLQFEFSGGSREKPVLAAHEGVVTCVGLHESKKYLFALVQNAEGKAVMAYYEVAEMTEDVKKAFNEKFVKGYKVTLAKGTSGNLSGRPTYVLETLDDVTKGEQSALPQYVDISSKVENAEDYKDLLNSMISVTGVLVIDGKNYYLQVNGKGKILIYVDTKYYDAKIADALKEGTYTVRGFCNSYNDTMQITPIEDNWYSQAS